jgi:hypothetical protein
MAIVYQLAFPVVEFMALYLPVYVVRMEVDLKPNKSSRGRVQSKFTRVLTWGVFWML